MTVTDSDGYKKFKEAGDKLKTAVAEKEEAQAVQKQEALNELETIRANPELAKMYQDSATVGAENLAGELPLLKVHSVGRSTKNELKDGKEPTDGWFFYKPTQEQFETVECHILTVSRGFRALGLQQGNVAAKEVFNQIVGGITTDDKPFIMYFTGLKLSYLWNFGKEASKYTKGKPFSIPMFALTVKLTTEKITNDFGKSWIIKFEVEKLEDGSPKLITDPGKFQYLKDNVNMVSDTIQSLIDTKTVNKDEDQVLPSVTSYEEEDVSAMPFS